MVFAKVVDSSADLCWLKMMKTELVTVLVSLRRRWCCSEVWWSKSRCSCGRRWWLTALLFSSKMVEKIEDGGATAA